MYTSTSPPTPGLKHQPSYLCLRVGPLGDCKTSRPTMQWARCRLVTPPSVLRRGLLICGSVLGTLQSPRIGLPTSKFSLGFCRVLAWRVKICCRIRLAKMLGGRGRGAGGRVLWNGLVHQTSRHGLAAPCCLPAPRNKVSHPS
jgi:hypothetical protein